MHVVAGRTLLAAVRERVDAEITAGRGEGRRMLEGDVEEPATTTKGKLDAFAKEEAEKEEKKEGEEGDDGVDARLELVVGGRIVATATRRRRGGDVTVFDARGPTAENKRGERKEGGFATQGGREQLGRAPSRGDGGRRRRYYIGRRRVRLEGRSRRGVHHLRPTRFLRQGHGF